MFPTHFRQREHRKNQQSTNNYSNSSFFGFSTVISLLSHGWDVQRIVCTDNRAYDDQYCGSEATTLYAKGLPSQNLQFLEGNDPPQS